MTLVQQIVNTLFVDLKIRAVEGELFLFQTALFLNHIKHQLDSSRNNTLVWPSFENRLWWIVLTFLSIIIAFHGVGLTTSSLAVREDSGMVTIDNMFYDFGHARLFKDGLLITLLVQNNVEFGAAVPICALVVSTNKGQMKYGYLPNNFLVGVDNQFFERIALPFSFQSRSTTDSYHHILAGVLRFVGEWRSIIILLTCHSKCCFSSSIHGDSF